MHNMGRMVFTVFPDRPNQLSKFYEYDLDECVKTLSGGGVIVFPTETLYGLGVDIKNDEAIDRLITLKGRPEKMPIAVAVTSKDQAAQLGYLSSLATKLIDHCLPKPITILVPTKPSINPKLTGGSELIGLRFPDQPVTNMIINRFGPITATSANLHGAKNPSTIGPIINQFQDKVDIYIDSGVCKYNVGSTVIDASGDTIKIIRYGACSGEELEQCLKI
jgi:L-threonylcarbamoyladenylate synthase